LLNEIAIDQRPAAFSYPLQVVEMTWKIRWALSRHRLFSVSTGVTRQVQRTFKVRCTYSSSASSSLPLRFLTCRLLDSRPKFCHLLA